MSLGINDIKASLSEGDSLLKYFIKQAHLYPTITYSTRYTHFITIQLDHVFTLIKNNIDSFLKYHNEDTLWIIDSAKRELVRPIYNEINSLKKIDPSKRSENELKRILSLISAFPNSKEKVWLTLQYYGLNLFDHPTYNNFCLACSKAKENADLIKDLFEKGWAYTYIGDFAKDHGNNDYSLTIYNFAQELFYRSDQDSTTKFNFQGWICEKIAKLFPNVGIDIIPGINKQSNYYLAASQFYFYGKDSIRANENFSKFILNYAYLTSPPVFNENHSLTSKQIEAKVLHELAYWYQSNIKANKVFTEVMSRWLYSIGIVLEGEHKFEEAKTFYLLSLLRVTVSDDINDIISSLCKLSVINAKLGKKISAFKYSDLIFNIAEKTDNNIYYAQALLNKATVFFVLKRYHSAIVYTNKITDAFAVESSDASTYTEIAEEAYQLKVSASLVLNLDSTWIYQNYYNSYRKTHYDELANVLISESEAIASWLNEVKSKEISNQKDQTSEVKALNEKISERNLSLIIGVVILLTSLLGLTFYYRKSAKQSKIIEGGLTQKVASNNMSTHDIKKLVLSIPRMLASRGKKGSIEKSELFEVITHANNVGNYVKDVMDSSGSIITSLESEYAMAMRYADYFKATSLTKKHQIIISNYVTESYILNQLPIPTFLINYFIKNSIEHGLSNPNQYLLNITINAIKNDANISIIIDDDGCGIIYAKKNGGTTKNQGMKEAAETIAAFNKTNNEYFISFNNGDVIDKGNEGLGKGTRVKLEFIKKPNGN